MLAEGEVAPTAVINDSEGQQAAVVKLGGKRGVRWCVCRLPV